ncbi:PTS transporter subunit EIIC [Anaerostipes caccae]|uniref:PTS transporter subunit EIIC n=1 Tax=Anaerostipes caccae TaxID=105841 RepID=UPI003991CC80
MKQQVQKFGRFLSGMVLPNISALIAWGFFTAIFLQGGWFPNEKMAAVISPMLNYLIPVLMGYTGGKMVYGTRGAVVGAVATFGIIIGGSIPMFLGAMIAGPLGGWLVKKLDGLLKDKIPTGFEMLYDNFSAGILGMILVMLCFWIMGPLVEGASNALGNGVKAIVDAGMLPLASVIIEPAKILFLKTPFSMAC